MNVNERRPDSEDPEKLLTNALLSMAGHNERAEDIGRSNRRNIPMAVKAKAKAAPAKTTAKADGKVRKAPERKAKSYSVAAALAVKSGTDVQAKIDLGRRYPLFAQASLDEIVNTLTWLSARKIEKGLRGDVEDEEETEAEASKAKTKAPAKAAPKGKVKKSKADEDEDEELDDLLTEDEDEEDDDEDDDEDE